MKIKVADLKEPLVVKISGSEEWLSTIYGYFPAPEDTKSPLITGELTVREKGYGIVEITGNISYAPFILCSRCAEPLQWPIERDIDLMYRDLPENESPRERELTLKEMDEFYIQNGFLDLELIVNEEIQLEVPSTTVPKDNKGRGCSPCADLGDKGKTVYTSNPEETDRENPFAVLKNLRLPN